jgi:hypothetical protein
VEQVAIASNEAIQNATTLLTELRASTEVWRQKAKPRPGSQLDQILTFPAAFGRATPRDKWMP